MNDTRVYSRTKLGDIELRKLREHPHYSQVRRLDFFKEFHDAELAQLLEWGQWCEIKAGGYIVAEGEVDITFYVLVSGKLSVVKKRKIIGSLKAGEPFGEMTFLTGVEPEQSAGIVASADSLVLALNPVRLESAALILRVRVAEAFMRVQAQRLRNTVKAGVHL